MPCASEPGTLHMSVPGPSVCVSCWCHRREELQLLFKMKLGREGSTKNFFQRAEPRGMSGLYLGHVSGMSQACLRHIGSLGPE